MYLYHTVFVHLSADVHLGYCHVLAVTINIAMNIRVQASFQDGDFDSRR